MVLLRRVRRAALGDPLAEWYARTARGAFIVISLVIALLLVWAVAVFVPDESATRDTSPPPAWSTNELSAKAILVVVGLGILLLLERIWRAIQATSPQPGWQVFPQPVVQGSTGGAALLSAAATLLGLSLWTAGIIAAAVAFTPQWVVGGVALILIGITVWGPVVVGLRYYEDLCTAARAEVALELKGQATGLEKAVRSAFTQLETVQTELKRLQSETDRARQAAAASRELAEAHEKIERYGRWRARREQLVFALLGVVLGRWLAIVLDANRLREQLPDWAIFG